MRRFLTIAALSVLTGTTLGCSKSSESNADPGLDISFSTDTGSQTDAQSADSGGTDTGVDTGPDLPPPVNPEFCDPVGQNCVDPAAPVCGIIFPPNNMPLNFKCRESFGDVGAGDSCTRPNDVPGEDDCAPGHLCSSYGFPTADPQQRACRPLCATHADCTDTARCIPLHSFGNVGTCYETCDPRGDDCVEGAKCSSFFNGPRNERYWICTNDSGASVGDPCTGSEGCGAGQFCPYSGNAAARTCTAFCADDLRCADGGACAQGEVNPGYGICEDVDWSCAGTPWPAVSAADAAVAVNVTAAGAPIANAAVNACAADDANCATPLASGTTDAAGNVTLTVSTGANGFDGYFEVTATGYLTELLYASAPIGEATATVAASLTTGAAEQPFAWTGALTLDAARGHIASVIEPCTASGGGAQVTLSSSMSDASTTTGYVSELAATGLLDTALASTTINGRAAMANHPVGTTTLTYRNSAGTVVAARQVVVRAGALTFVWVEPTP